MLCFYQHFSIWCCCISSLFVVYEYYNDMAVVLGFFCECTSAKFFFTFILSFPFVLTSHKTLIRFLDATDVAFFVCFFALVLCEIEIQYAVLSSPWLHALKSALNCSIYTAIFIIAHSRNLSMTMMKLYIKEHHFDERKYFLNNVNDVKDASHNL